MTQYRARLNADTSNINIIAIAAGHANGWNITPTALQKSLPLWNNIHTFIDHSIFGPPSVRDLAGICHDPRWDPQLNAITMQLNPIGPSAPLLTAIKADAENYPDSIGLSADILFTTDSQKNVIDIVRVYSLDLVVNPAAGGKFIRALNQLQERTPPPMPTNSSPDPTPAPQQAQAQQDAEAIRALLATHKQQQEVAAELEAMRKARMQACEYLLDAGLAASSLPAPMSAHVRSQFAGKLFTAEELNAAIGDARKLVSQLTAAQAVTGPHATGMWDTRDQLQAATDDLLGAPREPDAAKLRAHKLTGIRDLYHLLTGDYDLHGGYYPERTRLATTADFTGLVKNALNKIVVNQWDLLGRAGYDWWQKIALVEHFSTLQGITGTLVGTVGTLPSVAEGAEYTELQIGDSPETATFTKYGGYIPLTLELIDRDETRKLAAYPRELANAALRRLSALVAAVFTDNSGIGPTLADTGALFNATAVTTAGGHANLLTTALSAAEWETVCQAVYNQPMLIKNATGLYGTGPKQAINPRYLIVPRALQLTAMQILYPALERASNIYTQNLQRGEPGDVITVPEWTDADNWAAACDPTIAPAIYVGERFGLVPEIYLAGDNKSPAVFMNDEHRLKVRSFLAVWVNDFRPLHKSNV